jgi:hypothetical protein
LPAEEHPEDRNVLVVEVEAEQIQTIRVIANPEKLVRM